MRAYVTCVAQVAYTLAVPDIATPDGRGELVLQLLGGKRRVPDETFDEILRRWYGGVPPDDLRSGAAAPGRG